VTGKIVKWGNSQGLIMAKPLLEAAHLAVGMEVELTAKAGQIVVKPAAKRRVRIQDLVARMPKNFQPVEEGFGAPKGKEAW
jgi:antitoxin MazE